MFPLDGCSSADPLQGGYGWLQDTGSVSHPGCDLNAGSGGDADMGVPIRATAPSTVRFVGPWNGTAVGEGNHVWLETAPEWGGAWVHHDHLQRFAGGLASGQAVERGAIVGYCGKSGGWSWAHDHVEVLRSRPASWFLWPRSGGKRWTIDEVEAVYRNPLEWFAEMDALAALAAGGMTVDYSDTALSKIGQALWGSVPFSLDTAIGRVYADELKAGRYRGAPAQGEEDLGDGVILQRFVKGGTEAVCLYEGGVGASFAE